MRAVWIALVLALMLAGCAVETDVPPVSTSGADTPTVSSVPPPSPPILDSSPMSEITAELPDAEEQAVSIKPEQTIVDELTLRVLTPDGKPVPNLGVYGNPNQSAFLASSTISTAVTNNEGIAILQRVRAGEEPNEVITVGLADRNQSDVIQQKVQVAMPDSGSAYEPQTIVWNIRTLELYRCKSAPSR